MVHTIDVLYRAYPFIANYVVLNMQVFSPYIFVSCVTEGEMDCQPVKYVTNSFANCSHVQSAASR